MSAAMDFAHQVEKLEARVAELEAIVRSARLRGEQPEPTAVKTGEAARRLGCSRGHIHNMIKDGRLHAVDMGSFNAIPVAEIDRLLGRAS